jgi:hypothetical protein
MPRRLLGIRIRSDLHGRWADASLNAIAGHFARMHGNPHSHAEQCAVLLLSLWSELDATTVVNGLTIATESFQNSASAGSDFNVTLQ